MILTHTDRKGFLPRPTPQPTLPHNEGGPGWGAIPGEVRTFRDSTRTSRRGFSMIEVVLVLGGVSIILGLCAGLLHVMLRLERAGRLHLAETVTVGRLAHQFRQDVHAALRARPAVQDESLAAKLELVLPAARQVDYEAAE